MKIYKISGVRNKFDLAGIDLSNQVFSYLKNSINSDKIKAGFGYRFPLMLLAKDIKRNVSIMIKINYHKSTTSGPFSAMGEYVPKKVKNRKSDIDISINFYQDFSKNDFWSLRQRLMDIFRHEMEHMEQDGGDGISSRNYDSGKLDSSDLIERFHERVKYLKSQLEQDAFIREYMLRAKKTRQSLNVILESFINYQLFSNDNSIEKYVRDILGGEVDVILENLRETYFSRAKEIFPKFKFN